MKASVGEYMAKVYGLAVGKSIDFDFGWAIVGDGDLRCLVMGRCRVGDDRPGVLSMSDLFAKLANGRRTFRKSTSE